MEILNRINDPSDLKNLNDDELNILAKEIRSFLVNNISKTGGHLSSNLGVIELTIALHKAFESPKDKIIWDVGHQAYVHKILTGRKNQFDKLRQLDGLSGFPKFEESEHDAFNVGHAGTAISAGFGYCKARDIQNKDFHVVSIVGDGALTCGLSYEALNNAGQSGSKFVVILNDNGMAISDNVGAMNKYLSSIRASSHYNSVKKDMQKILDKIPLGDNLETAAHKTKQGIKNLFLYDYIFENLGFKYFGPIDGHDINSLNIILKKVKKINAPVLVHVITNKGSGYEPALIDPSKFHGIGQFDFKTGVTPKAQITYSDVAGKKIVELAKSDNRIVAITSAMPSGTGLENFAKEFPERFFDTGIAESHAVTFAGGLAKEGLVPFFFVYSTFLQRAYDQVMHDICLQNLHVVFAIDRAGIVGNDGETHQGLYDIAFLNHIPNLTIIAPKDVNELEACFEYATNFNRPIAIRYPKSDAEEINSQKIIITEKYEKIKDGDDIAIVSVGTMYKRALEVVELLDNRASLYNARFIKPIENDLITELSKYKYVFILEDSCEIGSYGSYLFSQANQQGVKFANFKTFAFPDKYIEQGSQAELFERYNLDSKSIYNKIKEIISK